MPNQPLTDSNKKTLHDIKKFAELVKDFGEKIDVTTGEQRSSPIVLFVKNYLRYYSTALINQVIDIEFKDSFSYFENTSNSLMEAFLKLNNSYSSTFQDEQIAEYANIALEKSLNEKL